MLRLLFALLLLSLPAAACSAEASDAAGAAGRPVRYVAIGASDAVGLGARDPERESWVARLHKRLPAGSTLVNLGVSGTRLTPALQQQLPVAAGSSPDLVTVWLAVNDLNGRVPLQRYTEDLDLLLGTLAATGATVLVGNVPDLALLPAYRAADRTALEREIGSWNRAIAASADRNGAVLVDLHARWREYAERPEYVSADGFHPSSEGHARLAEIFWEALVERGGPRVSGG